jgi:ubiquinone/menaquinone biosynthesis C-methylase UbiE
MKLSFVSLILWGVVGAACSTSGTLEDKPLAQMTQAPDVIYEPTPAQVVTEMLKIGNVTQDDVVYDLGSGDGRIVIAAAQTYGARGVGVEIDPDLLRLAQAKARTAGVSDRVKFIQEDLFAIDFSEATVITLYLLPHLNLKLRPKLLALKPGTRVVSHDFSMGEWKPEKTTQVGRHTIYYWVVPPPGTLQLGSGSR